MLERSSLLVSALALTVACGGGKKAPEADPTPIVEAFNRVIKGFPGPGFTDCKDHEVVGGVTMTAVTFFKIAGHSYELVKPEYQEWVNPGELDSPAARTLADAKSSEKEKRQAAAELLKAPFFLLYHVDLVSAPMALEVKELKRGTVGARAVRFDQNGSIKCVRVFQWQNDKAVSDSAIARSNKTRIDPAIARELQDDLRKQMLKRIQVLSLPQAPGDRPDRTPDNMGN